MYFRTLKQTDIPALNEAFNLAFDNYFVDMQMTLEQFEERFLKKEKIDFDSSGAFFNEEGNINAFIMHSVKNRSDEIVAYNTGTGVIPANRGQKLSVKLYENILIELKKNLINSILLEVITENHAAIHTYEKLGFHKIRTLDFFGTDEVSRDKPMREIHQINWQNNVIFNDYSDFEPSCPCIPESFKSIKDELTCFGLIEDKLLKGYAITNTETGRISFLGVHKNHRNKGIGTALFNEIVNQSKKNVTILNIPTDAKTCHDFLVKMGMKVKVSQFEMRYNCQ